MCIGVPMRIISVDGMSAEAEVGGRRERISLALVDDVEPGDHALVYLGSAVRRMSASEAEDVANALEAVANAAAGAPFEHLIQDLIDREPALPPHLASAAAPGKKG